MYNWFMDSASLSPEDLKKLTDQLSHEIDQEIKKQLDTPHPTEPQNQVNQSLGQPEPEVKLPEPTPTKPDEKIEPIVPKPSVQLEKAEAVKTEDVALDPLRASINAALENLKEGDQVDGWKLSKVYSTSFGHNKSLFYELENAKGAKKTLNKEEMKELLKTSLNPNTTAPDLAPKPTEPSTAPKEPLAEPKNKPISVEDTKTPEKSLFVAKPETENSRTNTLSGEQIDFLKKIHEDPKLWKLFSSFNPKQIEEIQTLYQTGKLPSLGIAAHPLLDQLNDGSLGESVTIKKGDSISSILTNAGFQLNYQPQDSFILGVHVLANGKFLKESLEKIQSSGLSTPTLPEPEEIIVLAKDGNGGNTEAYHKLLTLLTFLPVGSKLRIFSPQQVDDLKQHFQ